MLLPFGDEIQRKKTRQEEREGDLEGEIGGEVREKEEMKY